MNTSKCAGWLLLTSLAASSYNVYADDENFDDRFYVAPMFSSSLPPNGRHVDNGYGGGIAIGKSLAPHLDVEILGNYLIYKGDLVVTPGSATGCGPLGVSSCPTQKVNTPTQRIYAGGLGANLYLSPSNRGLFLHGSVEAGNHMVYNGGLGGDFTVTESGIGFRFEALYHKEANFIAEPMLRIGVRIPLGSLEHPQPPPPADAPVTVVPVEEGTPTPATEPETPPAPAADAAAGTGTDTASQPTPVPDAAPQEAQSAPTDTPSAAPEAQSATEAPQSAAPVDVPKKAHKASRKKHKAKSVAAPEVTSPSDAPVAEVPAQDSSASVAVPPSQPADTASQPAQNPATAPTQSPTVDGTSQSSDDSAIKVPETPYTPDQPAAAQ